LETERVEQKIEAGAGGDRSTSPRPFDTHHEPFLTGCVSITGAWEGAVTLDCSAQLARKLAAVMMRQEPEQTSCDDIADALGELTNILGGNVKRLLPGPSRLTLPAVAEGRDYHLKVAGSQLLSEICFECEGEPMRVTLLQRDENGRRSLHPAIGPRGGGSPSPATGPRGWENGV
jgi:chemotaxis protein CheX